MAGRVDVGRARGLAAALAALVAIVGVSQAGVAGAQGGTDAGTASLELSGKGQKRFERERIKLGALDGNALGMTVTEGTVSSIAQMEFADDLALTARSKGKRRVATVTGLEAVLGSDRSFMTGTLKGTRYTLWTLEDIPDGAYNPVTGAVFVDRAGVKVDRAFAAAVDKRLKTSGGLARKLGKLSIDAQLEPVDQSLESPPVLVRPVDAVDVTDLELTWRYRESFVDYVHSGQGNVAGSFTASDGATEGPGEVIPPSPESRVYQFDYTPVSGWSDGAGTSAETTGLYFDGKVRILKAGYGIDLDAQDVEVELNGDDSRLIALLDGRLSNANQANRRAVAVDLDLDEVTPTVTDNGASTTYDWNEIPATVPGGDDTWPIADFYSPGAEWGWVSVSYTVPDGGVPAP